MNTQPLRASAPEPRGIMQRAARLRGRGLDLARAAWIALTVVLLVIFAANVPAYFQLARTVCTLPDAGGCPPEQLTPAYVLVLDHLHVSLVLAQGVLAALCVAVSVLYVLLGLLIFRRKSHEWMGLLVALLLVMFGSTGFLGFNLPTRTPTLFLLLAQSITHGLMWPAMLVFFFTFPTGRFTPRWTWAAFVPFFVVTMLVSLPASIPIHLVPGSAAIPTALLPIVVQVYRYLRVFDAVQRQQTKWFVFGLALVFVLLVIQEVLRVLAPGSVVAKAWYQLFSGPFWLLPWTMLLLTVSIPILRYRLWDIDVIINRTLVYGALTAILGVTYAVGVIGAHTFLRVVTHGAGANQPLLIVATTLLIAALFRPLRRRVQAAVDRRFYRRKYDAERTLSAFGNRLHGHLELAQLTEHLVSVVEDTMRPAHVSLVLRAPSSEQTPRDFGA
ncbi:MAG TPA: hypothetical protein VJQ45_05635 [Ktedonobacterales bacterium]|nr:hypothetical protein [Ktedonobacterales bacterium]